MTEIDHPSLPNYARGLRPRQFCAIVGLFWMYVTLSNVLYAYSMRSGIAHVTDVAMKYRTAVLPPDAAGCAPFGSPPGPSPNISDHGSEALKNSNSGVSSRDVPRRAGSVSPRPLNRASIHEVRD